MPTDFPVPSPNTTEPNQAPEPERLDHELLAQAYSHLPTYTTASLLASFLVTVVLWDHLTHSLLLAWSLTVWLLYGLRYLSYRFYRHASPPVDVNRWRNLFQAGQLAAGLAWGSAGIILFAENSPTHQVFLAFVLGGMVAGATTSLATLQIPLRIFVFLLIVPISLKFYLVGGDISLAMSLMMLLFGSFSVVMSAKIYRILRSSLTLRLINREEMESREKAEKRLTQYQGNLERLVFERTKALTKSNEELFHEIVERKKAEKEKDRLVSHLLHTQKMEAIGTMAGGIAHDFNNILSIVIGYTELAREELPAGSPRKADLQEVLTAAQRGRELVRQILQFSRNDDQKPVPINLQELIGEVKKLMSATTPASVEIKTELDRECGPILADPNQMHRVLTNLATNAVHAMEEKGVLTFSLRQVQIDRDEPAPLTGLPPGPYARISVCDTGVGIDPELRKRIFEPFFTTKEVGKGSGMGLAVVHGIVSSNRGLVTVESEPGRGSSFHLFFPITRPASKSSVEAPADLPSGRERILVVDDDLTIAAMIGRLLTGQGYQVTTGSSGSEALRLLRAEPEAFDLIITDQTMPEMTGLELAEELLNIRLDLPVIICTGYSSKISPETISRAGIKKVLMKPVAREELARLVREVLD